MQNRVITYEQFAAAILADMSEMFNGRQRMAPCEDGQHLTKLLREGVTPRQAERDMKKSK